MNPARWKGHLTHLLPSPSEFHEEQRHAAMPYADVPFFVRELKEAPGVAPQALTFAILTGARGNEGGRRDLGGDRLGREDIDRASEPVGGRLAVRIRNERFQFISDEQVI